ncbi:MAG: preprotein translocase subunit SecA [Deltaproteobacteria bacterium]|nr:preprotein translocase subunit SecA [Deltaproteobacteria bacterium]
MFQKLLAKAFGTKNDREIKKIQPLVAQINALEPRIKALDDDGLRGMTGQFKERLSRGAALDDVLPEAFAVVREAAWRRLGQRHYDVQLIGGYALHKGMVAEMRTGEGKTLVATLPAYLNALSGKGVHVVTVNDYLAARDCEWMSRVYNFLGLSSGVITTNIDEFRRRSAYNADITYGQNNELGFDYLRDNMKYSLDEYVHRYLPTAHDAKADKLLNFAIVDEVDSILIDEARTPLIISGRGEDSTEPYLRANALVAFLKRDLDYIVDEKAHIVSLTESGVDKAEARLKVPNLYDAEHMHWLHYIHAALKAHTLFRLEVNYLIEDGKIIIIDEHTGRKMPGRRWSDGIHQSIEAKEGLRIQEETLTLATITFQNYFRMYEKLCGMTGTAETEAEEFAKIYNLDVLVIPTNKQKRRTDHDDVVYKTEPAKFRYVIEHIKEAHAKGQPILVGTISVEKSQFLAHLLDQEGIAHNVLNAKQHAREADIVAQAGRLGAVTISTNMAGRGTDILLGGNPELLARAEVFGSGAVHQHFDENHPDYQEALERWRAVCADEKQKVIEAGGLLIIGTERHESRRIDNQLRGRAGRQGDPGESAFYLSLDDDLMRIFGGDRLRKIMEFLKIPEDEPIVAASVTNAISDAQKRLEGQHFDSRKNVLEYDDVMNLQRKAIYALRRRVLAAQGTEELVQAAVREVVYRRVDGHCPQKVNALDWDVEALEDAIFALTDQDLDLADVPREFEALVDSLEKHLLDQYQDRRKRLIDQILHTIDHGDGNDALAASQADDQWRYYEREAYLRGIDTHWREHLRTMETLKEGVYLEAYAQKDPKLIYKKQGYEIFKQMIDRVESQLVEQMFRVEVKSADELERLRQQAEQRRARARRQLEETHASQSLHDEAEAAAGPGKRPQAAQAAPTVAQRPRAPAQSPAKRAQMQKRAERMHVHAAWARRVWAARKSHMQATGDAPPTTPAQLAAALSPHPAPVATSGAVAGAQAPAAPAKPETVRRERPKVGRNDPCWCGSGQKYKKCHMAADEAAMHK